LTDQRGRAFSGLLGLLDLGVQGMLAAQFRRDLPLTQAEFDAIAANRPPYLRER